MTAELPTGLLNVTNEEHHQIKALSNSGMQDLAVSTLRYWFHHVNPAPKPDEEETAAKRMGSALHCAVLESEETFESRYVRELDPSDWPVCLDTADQIKGWIKDKGESPVSKSANGKAAAKKEDWSAQALAIMERIGERIPILMEENRRFFAQHVHKTILKTEEWERIAGMAQALADEPALRPILREGKAEQTLIARDPETGVLLKARLDWMAPGITLDLKTFTQKRGKSIDKSIHDAIVYEAYHRKAVFYQTVRELATGDRRSESEFVFAFVESDQPHEVRLRRLIPKSSHSVNLYWESARIEIRRLIRTYADCLATFGDAPWRKSQEIARLIDEDVPQFGYGGF